MFVNTINPILFELGPLSVRYYGLFYGIGFLCSYLMLRYFIKQKKMKLTLSMLDDIYLYMMIGGLLGAKIFYVLVYQLPHFLARPAMIFSGSGMSFHGGLLGGIAAITLYIYIHNKKHKDHKLHFYDVADWVVIPFSLALSLGRIGNFMNHELYGRVTNVPWAVKFQGVEGYRHPSQIYESLYSLAIFGILWWMKEKKPAKGTVFWSFVGLYGVFRFLIEFFRQPDAQLGFFFGWMTMGQILCSAMIIASLIAVRHLYKREEKKYE